MAELSNLSVLLTGAAGGIGVAMAEAFAAAGARLALVDLTAPTELAARLGSEHRAYQIDLSDPKAVQAEVPRIGQDMGIDIVINNAGLGIVFPADEMNVEDWDRTFAVNLRGPWLVSAAALPYLKKSGRGRIVNIASQAGVVAIDDHAAYGSSKAALIGLTKIQALEWAKFGITVNSISPTVVETPMALVGWAGEKGEKAKADIPVGRFAQPSEIAAAALYFASEGAAIVTGANLMTDGGFTAK